MKSCTVALPLMCVTFFGSISKFKANLVSMEMTGVANFSVVF